LDLFLRFIPLPGGIHHVVAECRGIQIEGLFASHLKTILMKYIPLRIRNGKKNSVKTRLGVAKQASLMKNTTAQSPNISGCQKTKTIN
jgi:hypothetical protein